MKDVGRRVRLVGWGIGVPLAVALLVAGAGAVSAPSAVTSSTTLNPEADAYVDQSNPTKNYGNSATLRVDSSPIQRSYLRFNLGSVTGTITGATLRVFANTAQSVGYDVFSVADTTWVEGPSGTSKITYSNAPALAPTKTGSSGAVAANSWTSVDVTPLASAGHKLSLALTTTSSTALSMASREATNKPQLIVTTTTSSDTQPPTVPASVTATPASATEIDVGWAASTDDTGVTGYSIYRDGSSTPIQTVTGSTLSYADTNGITGGSTHSYTVDAFDAAGNRSAQSSPPASATTPDAAGCKTTAGSGYTVTVCLTNPTTPGSVTGALPVSATVTSTGSPPSPPRVRFCVDDSGCTNAASGYALTDFQPSSGVYSASLPTAGWVDGVHPITARAWIPTTDWLSSPTPAVSMTFSNGVTQPPPNLNTFVPTSGTPGLPFVVAAVGDGASGETPSSSDVVNLIAGWNPNLFLYLGDVYEKGSPSEFSSYYDPNGFFGRFRSITDPTVGNHEYSYDSGASGYFNYWQTTRHYYSFDAGGWHFISLDSTSQYNQTSPGTAQYQWLVGDLSADTAPCTLVYYHHPLYNTGPEGPSTRMSAIWSLLVSHGGVLVLNGHDHDYQRFAPLDWNGQPNANGVTEIIAGTGGHGLQTPVTSDPNQLFADFTHFGALKLQLLPTSATFAFITTGGVTQDSGTISCNPPPGDTTPPSAPTNLTASAPSATKVTLSWTASTDNIGVTGYDIYRDGSLLTQVGSVTTYNDTTVVGSTQYSYFVKARDAAGNVSDPSNTATVTTPSGSSPPLFTDDFESGTLTNWTTNTGLVTQQHDVYAGAWAAEESATTAATWAYKTLAATQTDLYYRVRFKVISQGANNAYLLKIRTATGTSILGLYRSSSGTLALRNDAGAATVTSSTAASAGVWHTIELHATINGTAGATEVWLDGNKIAALSLTQNLGTTPIGRVQLGDNSGSRAYDIALDDVAVDTAFIGT